MSAIWKAIASCSASLRPNDSRVRAYSTEASYAAWAIPIPWAAIPIRE